MKRFFGNKQGDNIIFEEGEAQHIRQVLRMQVGDKLIGLLNDENNYYCTITEITKQKVVAVIDEVKTCPANPQKEIVLMQAMPKREYFENIVTKTIELGVSSIVPFISRWSVNHEYKKERINTIVATACKQCERSKLVEVTGVVKFDDMLAKLKEFDIVLFANEKETENFNLNTLKNYNKIAVVVGCEGGFAEDEIEAIKLIGATSISLGKRILRCDTATVAMMSVVNILSGN